MTPRPRWRWYMWCAVNWLWRRLIVPEWVGDGGAELGEEAPF